MVCHVPVAEAKALIENKTIGIKALPE